MKKYLHVLNIGIQNTLVYRVNFLFRSIFGLIPLMATISLWRAIYSSKEADVAGYTIAQMISYYLVVTIVDSLTAVTEDDWQFNTGKVVVATKALHLVDAAGRAHPRRHALGNFTSRPAAGAFARPRTNAPAFRQNDAVARVVLAELAEAASAAAR